MSGKKFIASIFALLSISIVGISIAQSFGIKAPTFVSFHSSSRNSISGREGSDGPVLVVKIDDTQGARPQEGLESADLVYIEQVEGGLTRLAAVFSSAIPSTIGPVRSARISDIDLLSQYGKVAFSYSGVQKKMIPVIAAANIHDVGAMKYGAAFYKNDPARTPPYAMMLSAQSLMEKVASNGVTPESSKNMGWNFGDQDLSNATSVRGAHFSWPASSYDIAWDGKRWLLSHLGTPDMAASGEKLTADTFVAQIVSITDSIYHDKVGGVTPYSATIGSGDAYIFRDGKYILGRWNRVSAETGTSFTTVNGDEINFKAGHIWIALLAKAPTFTLDKPDAPSTSSK